MTESQSPSGPLWVAPATTAPSQENKGWGARVQNHYLGIYSCILIKMTATAVYGRAESRNL